MQISRILDEDRRRRAARPDTPFDPVRGDSSAPDRVQVPTPMPDLATAWVPRSMTDDPAYHLVTNNPGAWERLRLRHDFAYWCVRCALIKPKLGFGLHPFVLNAPQRRLVAVLEADRLAGRPMRVILLKARQWGGTTLIQHYMAWIQLVHRTNWNSLIFSNLKDTSCTVRAMYEQLLANYPDDLLPDGCTGRLVPFHGAANTRMVPGRRCTVGAGSVYSHDFGRGSDIAMAHLTEVAFWKETLHYSPEALLATVCGTIPLLPYTLVAIESTANGVGNFFHKEWLRCKEGRGDKRTVFVPWYEIEIYRLEPDDPEALAASLTDYERMLFFDLGLCLDQIYWYRRKLAEMPSQHRMMAEYPTTDDEAFTATSWGVFNRGAVERLRSDCLDGRTGEVTPKGLWADDPCGKTVVWQKPAPEGTYVASVDIGGRTESTDWSVIAVMRTDGPAPEVVAQWRGHADHDIVADTAASLAAYYNSALLAVESNSLESENSGFGQFVLERLVHSYPNLYYRAASDEPGTPASPRPGFHTNRSTKEKIITAMVRVVREGLYVERDAMACDEMLTYESRPDGRYGAKPGCHDDILMSRAIALYVSNFHFGKDCGEYDGNW